MKRRHDCCRDSASDAQHWDHLSLKDSLASLRRGLGIPGGKKVLIVIDQFEQWLHATATRRIPSWCKHFANVTAAAFNAS